MDHPDLTVSYFMGNSIGPKRVKHIFSTVRPVLSVHSKIDKIKVLNDNGSLMKVESIAECSLGAFCKTFELH